MRCSKRTTGIIAAAVIFGIVVIPIAILIVLRTDSERDNDGSNENSIQSFLIAPDNSTLNPTVTLRRAEKTLTFPSVLVEHLIEISSSLMSLPDDLLVLLTVHERLYSGQTKSLDGFFLSQKLNGNFELHQGSPSDPRGLVWETGYNHESEGGSSFFTSLQDDGMLITRRVGDNQWFWKSGFVGAVGDDYLFVLATDHTEVLIGIGTPTNPIGKLWSDKSVFIPRLPVPAATPPLVLFDVNERLYSGQTKSFDGFFLSQVSNGNFELHQGSVSDPKGLIWETGYNHESEGSSFFTSLQDDGMLITRRVGDNQWFWKSGFVGAVGDDYFFALAADWTEVSVGIGMSTDPIDELWSDKSLFIPRLPVPAATPPLVLFDVNERLYSGQIKSFDGFFLSQVSNGNFELHQGSVSDPKGLIWETGYNHDESEESSFFTSLQDDGMLITRRVGDDQWFWKSDFVGTIGENYFFALAADWTEVYVGIGMPTDPTGELWSDSTMFIPYIPTATHAPLPPVPAPDVFLLAYYYAWYVEDDWSRHGTQGVFPLLGLYGTSKPQIAEQHIDWALRAGIDALVVSWGTEDVNSDLNLGMLQAANIDEIKYCLHFESYKLPTRDFANPLALEGLVDAMVLMRDQHFGHPSYLYVQGRPVVVLYITRTWENFKPYMVDTVKQQTGVDIFFIGDEPWFGYSQGNPFLARNGIQNGQPTFDAYTTYNMYTDPDIQENQTATEYMTSPKVFNIIEEWSKETVFYPNVMPKYHDFRVGHLPLTGGASEFRTQLEAFACLPRPNEHDSTLPNMMFVTSFNEWWEGSQIEPDDGSDGYGFTFIDKLKAFKEEGALCPSPRP